MGNNMEEIDKLIKETLTAEEAKFYDELEEQGVLGKIGSLFKGKMSWLLILMNIVHLAIFGVLIYCVVQFLNTEETSELIKWGIIGITCMMFMSMIKLFGWMQMDKNALMRELKRLELQISSISHKIQQ